MKLGDLGPVLADFYQQGLTIEQSIERELAEAPEPAAFERVTPESELPEAEPPQTPEPEPGAEPGSGAYPTVEEVLAQIRQQVPPA